MLPVHTIHACYLYTCWLVHACYLRILARLIDPSDVRASFVSKTLLAEFATSFARPRHGLDTLSTQSSDDLAESYLIPDVASRPISTHRRIPSLTLTCNNVSLTITYYYYAITNRQSAICIAIRRKFLTKVIYGQRLGGGARSC